MTTLVLLHAFPYDSGMFMEQTAELERTAHLITPDLPGFGVESAVPGITVDRIADLIVSMLDRRDVEKAVIGGVSMGGYIAMAMARRYPEIVSGLILADTRADADDDAAKANRVKALDAVQAGGVSAFVEQQVPKQVSPSTLQSNPKLVEKIKRLGGRQTTSGVVEAIKMLRDRPDARPGLTAVKCPTLIVVGEDDAITPPSASEAMKSLIPHASLVRIPQAGHLANWERPVEFNAAVRSFLNAL